MINKRILFFFIAAFIIVVFVLIFIVYFSLNNHAKTPIQNVYSTPTATNILPTVEPSILPPVITTVPTLPNNQGLDLNSREIQDSIGEIQKIYPALPYSDDYTSSTGVDVSILIPGKDFQDSSWTLTVNVSGINYNTSPDQSDYNQMKSSFIEAANKIFTWINNQRADPKKIIYQWGDKKYIQDQATAWLSK